MWATPSSLMMGPAAFFWRMFSRMDAAASAEPSTWVARARTSQGPHTVGRV